MLADAHISVPNQTRCALPNRASHQIRARAEWPQDCAARLLVLVFSVLLCVLAFISPDNSTILEVVKLSFTIILGFFFGSQTAGQKTSS
jgi:hypothetical protein